MNRARVTFAATLVASTFGIGMLASQATQAPPMASVLAGKKLTPPAKGEVIVEFTNPVTKPSKKGEEAVVITTFQVKNPGLSPIARLAITETWYDKAGTVVGGGKGDIPNLFQPGEIKTITIESSYKPSFVSDQFTFTHANGTVKPKKVAKLSAAPAATAPAKAPAAAAKPAAAKK